MVRVQIFHHRRTSIALWVLRSKNATRHKPLRQKTFNNNISDVQFQYVKEKHSFPSRLLCATTSKRTNDGSVKLDLGLGLSANNGKVSLRLQLAGLADVVALVGQLGRVDDQLVLAAAQVLDLNTETVGSKWVARFQSYKASDVYITIIV